MELLLTSSYHKTTVDPKDSPLLSSPPIKRLKLLAMPLMVKIWTVETLDATSLVVNQTELASKRTLSQDPAVEVVEMEHPAHCSSEISVLTPNNIPLSNSSQVVVPLRQLELQWEMMVEPKDLPMLNSKAQKLLQRLLNLTAKRSTVELLDLIYLNHQAAVVLVAEVVAVAIEAASAVAEAASEVASVEIEAASVEEEVASVIEAAEAASAVAEVALLQEEEVDSLHKINL